MKVSSKVFNIIKIFLLALLVFYICSIIGYVALGKGSLVDAITLKSIRHIKDIIYN